MTRTDPVDEPAATTDALVSPAQGRPRWLPFAIVGGLGLVLAVLQYVLDDRDKLVFSIPILVITGLLLAVMAIAMRGGGDAGWEEHAAAAGLEDDGVKPLPPVTPILAGVHAPTRVFSGRLYDGGPWVRLARVGGELVAITDAPATAIDADAQAWLDEHPLKPRAGIAEELLVLAAPSATPPHRVLDLLRALHARL